MLLGISSKSAYVSSTGVLPSVPALSHGLRLRTTFLTLCSLRQNRREDPTTPHRQHLASITPLWFGLFRVRSPLLTESLLFSLPVGTEMFHFPTFPPLPYVFRQGRLEHDSQPGFPIRTSPDHSSVDSSPRLIAASYVLLRLLMPRHPPCALSNLPQKSLLNNSCELLRMLASTMQFSIRADPPHRALRFPE